MEMRDKIAVVTGGASGIGRELCRKLAREESARHVVVVDRDGPGAEAVAAEIGGTAFTVDVADPVAIETLVDTVERDIGPIDLFCSNAGIVEGKGIDSDDATWDRIWHVNTLSHVFAARTLIPRMAARGGGYLLNTASAAGLLSQIGSVTYAVTKHAAVALAEWLSITHHRDGIRVSVLCPQAVRTNLTTGDGSNEQATGAASVDGMLEPDVVAQDCIDAIREERFLVLPHPMVADYMQRKATDPDRWLHGMRRLQDRLEADNPD